MSKTKNSDKEVQYGTWEIGGPRHYYRERLILRKIRKYMAGGKVLDVGCGTGSLAVKLALNGYEVHGIDMSDECLEVTSKRLSMLPVRNKGKVKKGSALNIDYPDKFFDVIIAAEVLEHLEQDDLAVKEFYRLLRPGGFCIITVPENQRLWDKWDEMAGHKRRYYKDDLMRLFTNQSFKVESFFSWGFPLMRLYHRLIFLKWAKHIEKKRGGVISTDDSSTKIGLSPSITIFLGNVFRFDNFFSSFPLGIGILLVAKKP